MSKSISAAFSKGTAFIPFITCGDPDLETTRQLVYTLAGAGASLIELGIPFSDPTAEGETIQSANMRALAGGITTDDIMDMVASLDVSIPLVFMTYANIVFSYGVEAFVKRCRDSGISGLILPDVPFEEKEEFCSVCRHYGIAFISLIAATSKDRIAMIAREAEGFVYCVSSLGVTGMRSTITTDLRAIIDTIRRETDVPIAIGFGISTPQQAGELSQLADGVIIGSAIVKLISQHATKASEHVYQFAKDVVEACVHKDN